MEKFEYGTWLCAKCLSLFCDFQVSFLSVTLRNCSDRKCNSCEALYSNLRLNNDKQIVYRSLLFKYLYLPWKVTIDLININVETYRSKVFSFVDLRV